jgi:hypothetical protein
VNLTGCLYTVKLGIHYLRKNSAGGSIVIAASASSFMRFPPVDYSASPLFYLLTHSPAHFPAIALLPVI